MLIAVVKIIDISLFSAPLFYLTKAYLPQASNLLDKHIFIGICVEINLFAIRRLANLFGIFKLFYKLLSVLRKGYAVVCFIDALLFFSYLVEVFA